MTDRKPPPRKAASKRTTSKRRAPAKKTPATKAAAKKPTLDAQAKSVHRLRTSGATLETIAKRMKISVVDAHNAFLRALDATLPPTAEEAKRTELDRLDRLTEAAWTKAARGDLAALDRLVRLATDRLRVVSTDPLPPTDQRGPIEAATAEEVERLRDQAPALAAAALVLARIVDENRTEPVAAATAARELRITMSQLRGLAGAGHPGNDQPDPKDDGTERPKKGATVSWLDEVRANAEKKRRAR